MIVEEHALLGLATTEELLDELLARLALPQHEGRRDVKNASVFVEAAKLMLPRGDLGWRPVD